MNKKLINGVVAASAFMLALPAANAALSIRIFDGTDFATATNKLELSDDGTYMDMTAGDGVLNYSTSTAAWANANFGTSFYAGAFGAFDDVTINARGVESLGNPWADALDLNSLNVSGGAGTLTVMITETDLSRLEATWNVGVGGTTDGTVQFQSYIDSSNTAFGLGTLVSDLGPLNGVDFSASNSGSVAESDLYSWTAVATIVHTLDNTNQSTSFDYNAKIPEPSTLALLGLGVLGFGFAARRKRKA